MINTPYNVAVAITKSDSVNFAGPKPLCDAVYMGGAGIAALVMQDDSVVNVTFVAGGLLPIACKRVNSTNTTSTVGTALYCS